MSAEAGIPELAFVQFWANPVDASEAHIVKVIAAWRTSMFTIPSLGATGYANPERLGRSVIFHPNRRFADFVFSTFS